MVSFICVECWLLTQTEILLNVPRSKKSPHVYYPITFKLLFFTIGKTAMKGEELHAMMGVIMTGTIVHMTCIILVVAIVDAVEVSMGEKLH